MILAIRKSDGAVFEQYALDGLNPVCYLRDLSGREFVDYDNKYKVIFEEHPQYEEYLQKRV